MNQHSHSKYISLLEKAGTFGLYQKVFFLLTMLIFFSLALSVTSISFLFMNEEFNCSGID